MKPTLSSNPICEWCRESYTRKRYRTRFCSIKCKSAWVGTTPCCNKVCQRCKQPFRGKLHQKACGPCQQIMLFSASCKQCGAPFQKSSIGSTQGFCSRSCSGRWKLTDPDYRKKFYTKARGKRISVSRQALRATKPEVYAAMVAKQSAGMARYMNSLTMEERIARGRRQSKLLKAIGHKPKVRGGNGTGPTVAETVLLASFSQTRNNFPVRTLKPAGSGYPSHYKVDVAFPEIKLAIEADGKSHQPFERQAQDAKKTALLTELGWTVLRFTNKRIITDTENVKQEIRSIISRLKGTIATP